MRKPCSETFVDAISRIVRGADGQARQMTTMEILHAHLFCGLGGGAKGFNEGSARVGNAVPPPAARAIAGVMGRTLLLAWTGESFALSNERIWVRPVAVALSVDQARVAV